MSDIAAEATESTAPVTEGAPDAPGEGEGASAPEANPYEARLAQTAQRAKGLERENAKQRAELQRLRQEYEAAKAESLSTLSDLPPLERMKRAGVDLTAVQAELLADNEDPAAKQLRELTDRLATIESERQAAREAAEKEQMTARERALVDGVSKSLQSYEGAAWSAALGAGPQVAKRVQAWAEEHGASTVPADVLKEIYDETEAAIRDTVGGQMQALLQGDRDGAFRKILTDLLAAHAADGEGGEASDDDEGKPAQVSKKAKRPTAVTNRMAGAHGVRDAVPPSAKTPRSPEERRARALAALEKAEAAAAGR